MIPEGFHGQAERIEDLAPYQEAAAALGCEVAALQAVAEVESEGDAYLPDGRPPILYEAHIFSRYTGGRYDGQYPSLSSPSWDRRLYGAGGAHQYERLEDAMKLDRRAALLSCSWGRFQIMGFNYPHCGHDSVEGFVAAMCRSERDQLRAFVAFLVSSDSGRFLRTKDWAGFARRYNGPRFRENGYDSKMAAAYNRLTARYPVADVRTLQMALLQLGKNPGAVDGTWGPRTEGAVRAFLADEPRLDIPASPSREVFAAVQAALRERRRADV